MERDFSLFEHVKKRGIGSNLPTRYLSLQVFPRAGEVEKEKVARQVVKRGVFLRTRAEKEYVENVAWSRSVYLLQLVWIVWELSARVCFTVVVDRVTCLPYYPADLSSTWVHFTGEPIGAVGANRSDGHRVKLFEESVTFIAQLHPEVNLKKSCVTLDDWYCNWLLVALSGPRGHGSAARSNLDDWQLACTRVPNSNNSWHLFGRTYPIAPHRCARCLALLLHTP